MASSLAKAWRGKPPPHEHRDPHPGGRGSQRSTVLISSLASLSRGDGAAHLHCQFAVGFEPILQMAAIWPTSLTPFLVRPHGDFLVRDLGRSHHGSLRRRRNSGHLSFLPVGIGLMENPTPSGAYCIKSCISSQGVFVKEGRLKCFLITTDHLDGLRHGLPRLFPNFFWYPRLGTGRRSLWVQRPKSATSAGKRFAAPARYRSPASPQFRQNRHRGKQSAAMSPPRGSE